MDREKVNKGLECHHVDDMNRINCADCPYYMENDTAMRCLNRLHDDALELLKKQKVKTVQRIMKTEDNGTYFTMIWYECEECGHKINGDDCFCAGCGREVDRSEVIHDT